MLRRLNFSIWYYFHPPWDSGVSPPELMDFIANHPAGQAIDLGCGTGTNTLTLAKHGWQVTGVDFAPRAIRIAKRKLRQAGAQAQVMVGDVTRLKGISGPFDLALDLGCFHGIPARSAYLGELNRVLALGGYWLLYGMLKSEATEARPGLTEADIDLISASGLRMVSRKDGWDKRNRPSAWFLFQRPDMTEEQ
jgi:ubiquinone/menaquinone biosynthesis C-methylase UbiE